MDGVTTEGATSDGDATTVGVLTETRGAVREARSGTLTGGAAERRSRRAEWVRERAVAPGALVGVGVTVVATSPGEGAGAGMEDRVLPGGCTKTLPSCASESCMRGDTAAVCGALLTMTCTLSVTGAGAMGTSTDMVFS